MYLFLIDYSFMSSEHLQKIIGQVLPEEDVLNCFSSATMLKVSEKLKPRLVIIDFTLVEDDKVALVETLREKCPDTYILAVIDADYYDQLYQAIEKSLVDDYIVKPISEEEFAARILITVGRKRLSKPDFTLSTPDQFVSSENFETVEAYESEESDYKETMPTDSLLDEPLETESTKVDYFAPRFEEGYFSKKEEEELLDSGYDQANQPLNELTSEGFHAPEQLDGKDKKDDLFDDILIAQEAEKTSRSFLQDDQLETPPSDTGLGEDYFNDLFVEHYDGEEKAVKPAEPDIPPPVSSFSGELDNPPDKDIVISINDFMPGESADQYLKEKEDEVAFNFNEDLLDRFLSDEDEKNEVAEEDYDEENEPSGPVSFLSVLMNIILALLLLMMVSLSFFLIHNRVAEGPPSLAGFTFLVMQDEGVNADASPGSLAVIRPTNVTSISLGDIINFRAPASLNATATKRVVEINREEGLKFVTSGDGAGAVQTTVVPAEEVLGKVIILIPYYGNMVDYVQTIQGLILLIFVPGFIIIVFQLAKIVRHLSENRKAGRRDRYREVVEEE